MRSYARYWVEAFRLPVMPARRVVFALAHMGNYDLAGAWVIAMGAGSITTVAERLEPESVYDRFVAFREGLGVEVLPASGGTDSAFGILAQRLRAGQLVALVCDRDVTGTGTEVGGVLRREGPHDGPPGRARRAGRRGADARDLVVR